jgi:site-specific recombinase XerD
MLQAALRQLLAMLPAPTVRRATAVDALVARFDDHLRDARGLAPATRLYYRRYVRGFLVSRFADEPVDLRQLALGDVLDFVSRRVVGLAPGSANTVVTAIRCFLRFLSVLGMGDEHWSGAIPRAAQWRLAAIPQVLDDEQVATLLSAFDRDTILGRRDYAIALCFTCLGLRASEVAALSLDDLDWRRHVLNVAASKCRRIDCLPMVGAVEAAIADYLLRGRPQTDERRVFVQHRAPWGTALGPTGVRGAMRRGFQRAGFDPRMTGTHVLRRTMATGLLRDGASMKEIADVLRHRSLDTSAIYAKVDLPTLRMVALPWPEVRP